MALLRYKDDKSISTVIFIVGLLRKNERNSIKQENNSYILLSHQL